MSDGVPGQNLRRVAIGIAGTALGLLFLWLAFLEVDLDVVTRALRAADIATVGAAVVCYWGALGLRVVRWRLLLLDVRPVGSRVVGEILVCGYAMNNLLPARLGEFFRADLAKRRIGLPRSTVLGSIVVERLLDLAAIVGCLGLGLLQYSGGTATGPVFPLAKLLGQGACVVLVLLVGAYAFQRYWRNTRDVPSFASRVLANLQRGLATLQWRALPLLLALTVGVWSAEVLALWCVFAAFEVELSTGAAMITMGAASLSTLVPTAPAYLGSYQLVFAAVMPVLGQPAALGLAASMVIQLALFGSVTLAGLVLLAWRTVHNAGSQRADPVNADGREDPGPA